MPVAQWMHVSKRYPGAKNLPGQLEWLLGKKLTEQGLTVVNDGMSGQVHRDRKLITGDSPLAANALGRLAVETLTGKPYSA